MAATDGRRFLVSAALDEFKWPPVTVIVNWAPPGRRLRNGAEFLRINDSGTIATGKSGDLLVLDGNPADDITNTRKISAVYLKGVKIER